MTTPPHIRFLSWVTGLLDGTCGAMLPTGFNGAHHRCMSTRADHGALHICACGNAWQL